MEVKIFNPQLTFLGICETFNSFNFTRKFNDKGIFTLKVPFLQTNAALLVPNNIVAYDSFCGIIESVTTDITDSSTVTINGYEITYLLARRIILNTIDFSGTVEDFCRKAVNDNCIAATIADRNISLIALAEKANLTQTITKQTSYANLFDILKEATQAIPLGFRLIPDFTAKKLNFGVFEGRNTATVFSRSLDNISKLTYIDSCKDYANVAYVGGQGEGTARVMATVGAATGIDRYELFDDQKSMAKQDGQTDANYLATLTQDGKEKLQDKHKINTLDAETSENTDAQLGDNVVILDKQIGLKMQTFVSEINDIYDNTGHTTNLTFGYDVPSIYKKG